MLVGITVLWFVLIATVCAGWARFHRHVRALEGIDEADYLNGMDEASLRGAA